MQSNKAHDQREQSSHSDNACITMNVLVWIIVD